MKKFLWVAMILSSLSVFANDVGLGYGPGSITDRKTGEQIRAKCSDTNCEKVRYFKIFNDGTSEPLSRYEVGIHHIANQIDLVNPSEPPFGFSSSICEFLANPSGEGRDKKTKSHNAKMALCIALSPVTDLELLFAPAEAINHYIQKKRAENIQNSVSNKIVVRHRQFLKMVQLIKKAT